MNTLSDSPVNHAQYKNLSPRAKNFYNDLIVLCHAGEIELDVLTYVVECQSHYR